MIRTETAALEWVPTGAVSWYPDGSSWGALPHAEPHYFAVAARMGHEGDTLAYCRLHETCHHLVAEAFGRPSAVIWPLAHGKRPSRRDAASEEALAMALHRYVMANEHPLIDGVHWQGLKRQAMNLQAAYPVT